MRTFLHERALEKNGSDPQETLDYPSALAEKLAGAIVQAVATRPRSNAGPSPTKSSIARAVQQKNFSTAANTAKTRDLI